MAVNTACAAHKMPHTLPAQHGGVLTTVASDWGEGAIAVHGHSVQVLCGQPVVAGYWGRHGHRKEGRVRGTQARLHPQRRQSVWPAGDEALSHVSGYAGPFVWLCYLPRLASAAGDTCSIAATMHADQAQSTNAFHLACEVWQERSKPTPSV